MTATGVVSAAAAVTADATAAAPRNGASPAAVQVRAMQFSYPGEAPLISDFHLELPRGSRCLLVGANGAGKTTLLRILGGKHMVGGKDVVQILGRSAFHDTALSCDGTLAYLGGSWSRTVGCAGEIPLQGDFSAEHMIFGVADVDPARRERLIELLDIDLRWRMHRVSDGQRRRVQICMGLLRPFEVLLLDEITVDLDVVARMDLLEFFKSECEERGATLVYATHIFDGLEEWATHLAYVDSGKLQRLETVETTLRQLLGLKTVGDDAAPMDRHVATTLLSVVEPWLRKEKEQRQAEEAKGVVKKKVVHDPWAAMGRHMAYYR